MKIITGSDHAGFELKEALKTHLQSLGHTVIDKGPSDADRVDYPDFAAAVAHAVRDDADALGVLVCASGIGVSIAANKVKGIRAALVHNAQLATVARQHNNAQILCLGQRFIGTDEAKSAVEAFLAATFEGGRHAPRIEKIGQIETQEGLC